MKPFAYERAADPAAAVAAVAREPGAKFLAGGTNLVDLMKLEVETPAHLIDVNHLGLDAIEPAGDGGLRIGAGVRNADLANGAAVLDEHEIRERMSGNLCRCGAYANIVPAIAEAAR